MRGQQRGPDDEVFRGAERDIQKNNVIDTIRLPSDPETSQAKPPDTKTDATLIASH